MVCETVLTNQEPDPRYWSASSTEAGFPSSCGLRSMEIAMSPTVGDGEGRARRHRPLGLLNRQDEGPTDLIPGHEEVAQKRARDAVGQRRR